MKTRTFLPSSAALSMISSSLFALEESSSRLATFHETWRDAMIDLLRMARSYASFSTSPRVHHSSLSMSSGSSVSTSSLLRR